MSWPEESHIDVCPIVKGHSFVMLLLTCRTFGSLAPPSPRLVGELEIRLSVWLRRWVAVDVPPTRARREKGRPMPPQSAGRRRGAARTQQKGRRRGAARAPGCTFRRSLRRLPPPRPQALQPTWRLPLVPTRAAAWLGCALGHPRVSLPGHHRRVGGAQWLHGHSRSHLPHGTPRRVRGRNG